MSNFSIGLLTTAIVGFSTDSYSIVLNIPPNEFPFLAPTIGSISVINMDFSGTKTIPGFLTGRRPTKGQLYPRGVYNK